MWTAPGMQELGHVADSFTCHEHRRVKNKNDSAGLPKVTGGFTWADLLVSANHDTPAAASASTHITTTESFLFAHPPT